MAISLERINAKTVLFEKVSDQVFASVIKGKVVRDVSSNKASASSRTIINFADGSGVAVDEELGGVVLRYIRSQSEQQRDGHM